MTPPPAPAQQPEPVPAVEQDDVAQPEDDGWAVEPEEPQQESLPQPEQHAEVSQHDAFGSGFGSHDAQNGASAWGAPPSASAAPQWGSQSELPPANLDSQVPKQYDAPPGIPTTTKPYEGPAPTQRAFDLSSLAQPLEAQYGTDSKGLPTYLGKDTSAPETSAAFTQAAMPAQQDMYARYGFQPTPEAQTAPEPEKKDVPPQEYMQPAPGFGHQFGAQQQSYTNYNLPESQTKSEQSFGAHEKGQAEPPSSKAASQQEQHKDEAQDSDSTQQGAATNPYAHLPQDMNWGMPAMQHPEMYGMQGQRAPAGGQMPAQQGMMPGQPNMQMPGQSQAMTGPYMPNNPTAMGGFPGGYPPNMTNYQMPGYSGYMPPNMANFQMPAFPNAYGQFPPYQSQTPYNPAGAQGPFHSSPSSYTGKQQFGDQYAGAGGASGGGGRGRGRKGKTGRGGTNFSHSATNELYNQMQHGGASGQFGSNMAYVDAQGWGNGPARFDNFKDKQGQQGYGGYAMPYGEQGYGAFPQQYQAYPQQGNWGSQDKQFGKGGY